MFATEFSCPIYFALAFFFSKRSKLAQEREQGKL